MEESSVDFFLSSHIFLQMMIQCMYIHTSYIKHTISKLSKDKILIQSKWNTEKERLLFGWAGGGIYVSCDRGEV